jgi:hypothetical protein
MRGKWTTTALFTLFTALGVAGCGGPMEEEDPFEAQEEPAWDETGRVNALEQNHPPCKNVEAKPKLLWPPNHKFHLATLSGKDAYGKGFKVTIKKVTQDEPLNAGGDGNTEPDAKWVAGHQDAVQLRAERSGQGDGRVYRISFSAKDSKGKTCTGTAYVGVPHDMGRHSTPIDSGDVYDSFGD